MRRAFIVHVDIDPSENLIELAEDIQEAVETIVPVFEVQPWASPTAGDGLTTSQPTTT